MGNACASSISSIISSINYTEDDQTIAENLNTEDDQTIAENLDTEDDQTISEILAADEKYKHGHTLGKILSHLDSIPHNPRVVSMVPYANDASSEYDRLAEKLAMYNLTEMQIERDGDCQFRALADQLYRNPEYHKHVRKEVIKQLKHFKKLYESYVPMEYQQYIKKMERLGEWGDNVTLQAAADRFEVKICLVTSFWDTSYIEILPKNGKPDREVWMGFWSKVHYNSLYEIGGTSGIEDPKIPC